MKNTILLVTDNQISKAYIQALTAANHKPSRIVCLKVRNKRVSTIRGVLRAIKKTVVGEVKQSEPVWIKSFENYCLESDLTFPDFRTPFKEVLAASGAEVKWITVDDLDDEYLINYLKSKVTETNVIFGCGGLFLRKKIFSIGKRFIHVHPGVVPEVKGSDGMLWSALVRGRVGMSAFFMNEGIDTGDIIEVHEYDIPKLEPSDNEFNPRELIHYIDPVFRADALLKLFKKSLNPNNWSSIKQNPNEGRTYYFMHSEIQKLAARCFSNEE